MHAKADAAKALVIFIDQQQFKVEDRPYSPGELLVLAGEDPSETTLKRKQGHVLEEFRDPDKPISPKNGDHFVVFHNTPTPVS